MLCCIKLVWKVTISLDHFFLYIGISVLSRCYTSICQGAIPVSVKVLWLLLQIFVYTTQIQNTCKNHTNIFKISCSAHKRHESFDFGHMPKCPFWAMPLHFWNASAVSGRGRGVVTRKLNRA